MRRNSSAQRQARHVARIKSAERPGDRVAASVDYLRAAMADMPPELAGQTADEVAQFIVATIDRLERITT